MKIVMVKIRMASAKLAAKPMSKIHAGIGRIIMTMMAISANARRMVGWNSVDVLKSNGIRITPRLVRPKGVIPIVQSAHLRGCRFWRECYWFQ